LKLRTLSILALLLAACGSTAGSQSVVGPEVLADANGSGGDTAFGDVGSDDSGAEQDAGSDAATDSAVSLDTQVEDVGDTTADTTVDDTTTIDTTVDDTTVADTTADTTVDDTTAIDTTVDDTTVADTTADTTVDDTTTVDTTADTTAQVCEPSSTSCSGNILLTCADDGSALGRTRCSSLGQNCGTDPDGRAACVDPVCLPSAAYCVDAVTRGVCDASGAGPATTEVCAAGCNARTGACNALPGAGCTVEASNPIVVGDVLEFDLCGAGDDVASVGGTNDCTGGYATDDEDAIFELTLDAPATLLFDLQDADSGAAIDTLLYLRSSCDAADSELVCADDILCADSDITTGCTGEVQPRQSQFEATLDAGTYFIIAEQFTRGSFTCGLVQLSVTER
jgi:hypothetical protein